MKGRIVLRVASEVLLIAFTIGLVMMLVAARAFANAALVTAMGMSIAAVGLFHLRARGALALAWNCPQLDRAGLTPKTRAAPWKILGCADELVGLLAADAKGFRSFLPGASREVLVGAQRAVELHALARSGDELAAAELASIEQTLSSIRTQLRFASAPERVAFRADRLEGLHARTHALATAIAETRHGGES